MTVSPEYLEQVHWVLLTLATLTVALPFFGTRWGMPRLLLLGRWTRWFLFAGVFAYALKAFGWSFRPDWVHFTAGLGVWFVLETTYYWIAIKALSRSELPLFPEFKANHHGDEWPADAPFIELKEWLRENQFRRLCALKAELVPGTYLRASIYESHDKETRIQILFLPKNGGGANACYTICSETADGERLITDNFFLPFGGYYPVNWSIARRPLIGSLPDLLFFHERRIIRHGILPVPMKEDALESLNEQQRLLERFNTETGFLVPRPQREEVGRITAEGRYRIWKEMWFLAYFGRACV